MSVTTYRVKAFGFGFGLARYMLNFTFTSNYDINTHREDVMQRVRRLLKREWGTAYEILSVVKEAS